MRPFVSATMIEKIIVVAPTTAVPMSTGFAVALNVLPAPSFSSRKCFAFSKFTAKPYCVWISAGAFGICSIVESSNTDCALSVTGPYESTAIVTGPMPRKPNATRPNANTAGAIISAPRPVEADEVRDRHQPMIVMPSQYALKLPATRPDRMFSDGPPSRDDVTTSRTCRDSVDVNTFTNSGMIAPASVPHVMTAESFHHSEPSPRSGIITFDTMNVSTTERIDVSHTRNVSGASKFILSAFCVPGLRDRAVDQVRHAARDDHHDAHDEDPDEQLDLHRRIVHREHDERDERDTRHAVGLEAVGARTDRVAGVVARAVRDHAGVARVVFLHVEDDLHQVGADVGDLREDAAGDTQRRGAKRLTDREADEARTRRSRPE